MTTEKKRELNTSRPSDADAHDGTTGQGYGRMSRRRFLATGATTGAIAGMETIAGVAHAQESTPSSMPGMDKAEDDGGVEPLQSGFVHFTPPDAAVIAAAAARIIPTDDNGPGATEAGVVYFIDRQLAHENKGYTGPIYQHGPFLEGTPNQGDQSALSVADRFRLGIGGMNAYANQLYDANFPDLSEDQQDRILRDMEQGVPDTFSGTAIQNFPPVYVGSSPEEIQAAGQAGVGADAFFSLLLQYVQAGFFADPVHGGNRDMAGWKLIGFPGAQHGAYREWILRYGEEFTGEYRSLTAYQEDLTGGE